ncbi:MAG: HD domain-containing phosphohydrolase [Acidobacteriota bacterium]
MSGQRARLLAVDDQIRTLTLLQRVFSDHETVTAGSASQARHLLQNGPVPDLILLDVNMPVEDGFSLCRWIKAHPTLRGVPVIFLTGVSDAQFETTAFQVGGVDYVNKPFSAEVVRARVQAHLSAKAAERQIARHNELLASQVAQRTAQLSSALKQLDDASLEIIVRLTRAAEYRDELTGKHVLRVSYYAAAIARHLGYTEEQAKVLLRAAPLHDIGKIAVPDHILLKPGPLTPAEWEVMKTHTTIGARILAKSASDIVQLGETVALTHHERWEGGGYPANLAGTAIPIAGRIVALADVFDSLNSRRPYKPPLPREESVRIVLAERGKWFDPAVVDAFLLAESEISEIMACYADDEVGHSFAAPDVTVDTTMETRRG